MGRWADVDNHQLINLLPTIEFKEESLRQIAGAGEGGREALSEDDDKVMCIVRCRGWRVGPLKSIMGMVRVGEKLRSGAAVISFRATAARCSSACDPPPLLRTL